MTDASFPEAVAARAEVDPKTATDVLASARIPTVDPGGRPHRLRIRRLAFDGHKAGTFTEKIDFDQTFTDGLWAICSDKNDAGKTSLLEIIMWCLRGEPKRLQDDVRAWLDHVRLEGETDGELFVVDFSLDNGVIGTLSSGGQVHPFLSEAAFADTMSQFMMERLGFDSFEVWVNDQGLATHHWPAYSTVLYLPREAETAVIGDRAVGGLTTHLIQLFVGIPWARTHSRSRAASRQEEAISSTRVSRAASLRKLASDAVDARQTRLRDARSELLTMTAHAPSDTELDTSRHQLATLIAQQSEMLTLINHSEGAASEAAKQARAEKKRLRDELEASLARRLFQGLNPSRCPRCSVEIDEDRRMAEKEDLACAVCTRTIEVDSPHEHSEEDDTQVDPDLQDDTSDRAAVIVELEAVSRAEKERSNRFRTELSGVESQIQQLTVALSDAAAREESVRERRLLEAEIASLESTIEDLTNLDLEVEHGDRPEIDEVRLRVLRAAVDESKARRDAEFKAIRAEINEAVLDLAQRFGFDTLEKVKLTLAAQLYLTKGATETSFSKQTPGEKLRLRIAVLVALLRVANAHGVGRHPGLILIDSIGAEETEPGNLSEFMRELDAVTAELGVQTIVASARNEILGHVPSDRQIVATGEAHVW